MPVAADAPTAAPESPEISPNAGKPGYKRCRRAKHHGDPWLPLEAFARLSSSPDGRQPWCRQCHRDYSRPVGELLVPGDTPTLAHPLTAMEYQDALARAKAWRRWESPEASRPLPEGWLWCGAARHPGERLLPQEVFSRNNDTNTGYSYACKRCEAARKRRDRDAAKPQQQPANIRAGTMAEVLSDEALAGMPRAVLGDLPAGEYRHWTELNEEWKRRPGLSRPLPEGYKWCSYADHQGPRLLVARLAYNRHGQGFQSVCKFCQRRRGKGLRTKPQATAQPAPAPAGGLTVRGPLAAAAVTPQSPAELEEALVDQIKAALAGEGPPTPAVPPALIIGDLVQVLNAKNDELEEVKAEASRRSAAQAALIIDLATRNHLLEAALHEASRVPGEALEVLAAHGTTYPQFQDQEGS